MALKSFKSGSGQSDGTLKLQDWLEQYPGQCDEPFQVVRITRSQAYSGFSLECLAVPVRFRVFLGEFNPAYEDFEKEFEALRDSGTPIFIKVAEGWGTWELQIDDELTCQWKRSNAGYMCEKAVAGEPDLT